MRLYTMDKYTLHLHHPSLELQGVLVALQQAFRQTRHLGGGGRGKEGVGCVSVRVSVRQCVWVSVYVGHGPAPSESLVP